MNEEYKEITRHINRSTSQLGKNQVLKAMSSLVDGLEELIRASKLIGRKRLEVEILLSDALRTLGEHPEVAHLFPKGIKYQKGKEKQIYGQLKTIVTGIERAIEQAEVDKMRQRAREIDKHMLAAQKFLDEKSAVEARKVFRRVQETFAGQQGINQDIGTRLLKAGLAAESIEYFQAAVEQDSRDSRPYVHLVMAFEAVGELEKAEEMVKDTLRNFGPNERIYMRMAKLYVKMMRYDDAFDAANSALEHNPFSKDAEKLIKKIEPRIFGRTKKANVA